MPSSAKQRITRRGFLKGATTASAGVSYQGTSDAPISYLRVKSKNDEFGIPAYDTPVVGKYVRVKTTTAKTLV